MTEKTLLVIAPSRNMEDRDLPYFLIVPETGEVLASHFCSNYLFAYGDLYGNRPERIESCTERFGEHEVKFIDETEIPEEELIRRNKLWWEEKTKETDFYCPEGKE